MPLFFRFVKRNKHKANAKWSDFIVAERKGRIK